MRGVQEANGRARTVPAASYPDGDWINAVMVVRAWDIYGLIQRENPIEACEKAVTSEVLESVTKHRLTEVLGGGTA